MKKKCLLVVALLASNAHMQGAARLDTIIEEGNCIVTENLFFVARFVPFDVVAVRYLLGEGAQVTNSAGVSVLRDFLTGIEDLPSINCLREELGVSLSLLFEAGADAFDRMAIVRRDALGNDRYVSFYQALQDGYARSGVNRLGREKYAKLIQATALWALQNNPTAEAIDQISETVLHSCPFFKEPERTSFRTIRPLLKTAINHTEIMDLKDQIYERSQLELGASKFQDVIDAGQQSAALEATKNTIREKIARLIGSFDRELMKRRMKTSAFLNGTSYSAGLDDRLEAYIRYIEEKIVPSSISSV